MKVADLYIKSIGVELPEDRITLKEAIKQELCGPDFDDSDLISVAVANGAAPADMAVRAARKAIEDCGTGELQLLLHAPAFRQGPEGWSPVGYILRELGCGNVAGCELLQGCNGMLAAMEMAAGWLAAAQADATALLTTALNAKSPTLNRWRSGGHGIALGDGAAAVALGKGSGIARVNAVNSMMVPDLEAIHRGTLRLFEQEGRPRTVDPGTRAREFAFTFGLPPLGLHEQFTKIHPEIANRSLSEAGIEAGDLAAVIFINVGRTLTEMGITEPLGLPSSVAYPELGCTVGHLGAADHFVSLQDLLGSGKLAADDRVLLISGSPGYNAASAVLTIT